MLGSCGEGIQWFLSYFLGDLADKQARHLCGAIEDPLPIKFLNVIWAVAPLKDTESAQCGYDVSGDEQ